MTLQELFESGASRWGDDPKLFCDKGSWHSYTDVYQQIFSKYAEINLLEIGICAGGSIWLWQQYFQQTQKPYTITALEILPTFWTRNANFQTSIEQDPNIQLKFNTDATLAQAYEYLPQYDIIIDDGSHQLDHQLLSLKLALPHLNAGGTYVIEDIAQPEYLSIIEGLAQSLDPALTIDRHMGLKNNRVDDVMIILSK